MSEENQVSQMFTRRYTLVHNITGVETEVIYSIGIPVPDAEGDFVSLLTVTAGEDVRVHTISPPTDAWSVMEAALRIARSMIIAMHGADPLQTVLFAGKRSAGWL